LAFSVVEAWPLLAKAGITVDVFIGDSAHDANALYALLDNYGSKSVIELNKKPTSFITLNQQGIPLCPKGHLMCYWGFDEKKSRFKWRCPKIAGTKRSRDKIVCDVPCSGSSYGFTCYTKPEWDQRIFTKIARGSDLWKQLYKKRSASERVNKRYNDFALDITRVRDNCYWYHLAHLTAINIHLDAWVKQEIRETGLDKKGLLLCFLGIGTAAACA